MACASAQPRFKEALNLAKNMPCLIVQPIIIPDPDRNGEAAPEAAMIAIGRAIHATPCQQINQRLSSSFKFIQTAPQARYFSVIFSHTIEYSIQRRTIKQDNRITINT